MNITIPTRKEAHRMTREDIERLPLDVRIACARREMADAALLIMLPAVAGVIWFTLICSGIIR